MGVFKKLTQTSGEYKELTIVNDIFCDPTTGEQVDVIGELVSIYGENTIFSLKTVCKLNEEIEPELEEE